MKTLSSIEVQDLIQHLDKIEEYAKTYADVPIKSMTDYEVADIVKLRCGYEMINSEMQILREVLEI